MTHRTTDTGPGAQAQTGGSVHKSSPLARPVSSARPFARSYTLKVSSPVASGFAPMLLTIT
jgi:hypothetical protein